MIRIDEKKLKRKLKYIFATYNISLMLQNKIFEAIQKCIIEDDAN